MNATRRFWISFGGYFAWVILAIAVMGVVGTYVEAHPESILSDIPQWIPILLFFLAMVVPVPIMLIFFYSKPGWIKQVQRTGKLAPAQILKVKDTHVSTGGGLGTGYYLDLTVQVTPQDEAAFEARLEVLDSVLSIPSAGDAIMVRYDPADHRHIVLAPDAGVASSPHQAASHYSASPAGVSSRRGASLADQLQELETLHRSGALTDQEFQLAKQKLLAE